MDAGNLLNCNKIFMKAPRGFRVSLETQDNSQPKVLDPQAFLKEEEEEEKSFALCVLRVCVCLTLDVWHVCGCMCVCVHVCVCFCTCETVNPVPLRCVKVRLPL